MNVPYLCDVLSVCLFINMNVAYLCDVLSVCLFINMMWLIYVMYLVFVCLLI